jgi:hypothetical protein
MNKIFIVFASMVIMAAFVCSASAVDRAPKKSGSDSTKETAEIKEMNKEKAKLKGRKSTFSEKTVRTTQSRERIEAKKTEKTKARPTTRKSKEKYDYFIDRNNNGIDDRLERQAKAKKAEKKEPAKKPETVRKPTPSPSDKTPAKIKTVPEPAKKVKKEKVSPKKKTPSVKEAEKKQGPKRR